MTLYGLTCGYWSSNPDDVDKHVAQHVSAGKDKDLFDLCECHNAPVDGIVLRDCGEGVA
jgi:hypothetical protein